MKFNRFLMMIFVVVILMVGVSSVNEDPAVLGEAEAEGCSITGDYLIGKEDGVKHISFPHSSEALMNMDITINEACSLWVRAKIIDASQISISVNDRKVPIKKDSIYYKWIKLGDYDALNNPVIKVLNNQGVVWFEEFKITKQDVYPFGNEYVFDDLTAELTADNNVKIYFSGDNLEYADIKLMRRTTAESALENGSAVNEDEILAGEKYVMGDTDYFITDETPKNGYICEYYIEADNCFGISLKSKKIIVEYNSAIGRFSFKGEDNVILNTAAFKRYENEIENQNGIVKSTVDETKLFMDTNELVVDVYPDFLEKAYFFMGFKKNENVRFNVNKLSDVFVYVSDIDKCYKEYYYSKGFNLVRIPLYFTTNNQDGYAYFFYKRYRPGTGDALYLRNEKLEENIPLSVYVENNDIVVYFNSSGTLLEGSQNAYIKIYNEDNGQLVKNKPMTKINKSLFYYKLSYGAVNYDTLRFEFYNENSTLLQDYKWIYDDDGYMKSLKETSSNVVFIKEIESDDIDINFNTKTHTDYIDLESYIVDDGSIYAVKGNDKSYGMNKVQNVVSSAEKHNDNAKGFYDGSFLKIEYEGINSELVNADFVRIVYSFDEWSTEDSIIMSANDYNKWIYEIYPPAGSNEISFYFTDDTITDNNEECKWYWDFTSTNVFNTGYERNLVKKEYLELSPYVNNGTDDYEWSIEAENGIYEICAVVEKSQKGYSSSLKINEKNYIFDETYKETVQLTDELVVYNNKISLRNTSNYDVKIYGFFIRKADKQITTGHINPESFVEDNVLFDEDITEPVYVFENDGDVIKAVFDIQNIDVNKKYYFDFHAGTTFIDKMLFSIDGSFDNDSFVSEILLTNDLKTYSFDITSFTNLISANNNTFTLYIKANKGAKITTHLNENMKFGIRSTVALDEDQTLYQAMGTLSFNGTNYMFSEDGTAVSYVSQSTYADLGSYLDTLVVVSGYIEEGILNIIKVTPVLSIKWVEGDIYTNNQPLEWNVISDFPLTGLKYRINDLTDWTIMTYGTIVENIEADGEYVLEVIPMMDGYLGQVSKLAFTVDRTGPQLNIIQDLPQFTKETSLELDVSYADNYSTTEEISVFYKIDTYDASGDETLAVAADNKITINAEGIIEGPADITIYCTDFLGNKGNEVVKKTFFDFTPPTIEEINISYDFDDDYQHVIFDVIRKDNIGGLDITTHYKTSNNDVWHDTTDDRIVIDFNEFDTDGEFVFTCYAEDIVGLTSAEETRTFVIDREPIEKPAYYDIHIDDIFLSLTWESREDDPTFYKYNIRRNPVFEGYEDLSTDSSVRQKSSCFKDTSSHYDPDYIYYVSVIDIYGNKSEEYECTAIKYNQLTGNPGETKTLNLEAGDFKVTIDEKTPNKIGVVKKSMMLEDYEIGEYGILTDQIYHFEPSGSVFTKPAIWYVDVSGLENQSTEYKENLCVYTFDKVNNRWLEVETKYNAQTDKLEAKVYHFSDKAVGEGKENRVEVPTGITQVSPETGAVDVCVDLFNLNSARGAYNLQLKFNSGKFDMMSRKTISEKIADDDGCLYIETDYSQSDQDELNKKLKEKRNQLIDDWPNTYLGYGEVKLEETSWEDKDYKDLTHDINNLDGAWSINIPGLRKQDNKEDSIEYKFITFEDGSEYELKPTDYRYENRVGRKFVYLDLTDDSGEKAYLAKTEGYINYKFNAEGKCQYVFYSGTPEADYNSIDSTYNGENKIYNDSRILYSFSYNETDKSIESIKSYNSSAEVVSQITFIMETVKEEGSTDNIYIKRIKQVNKQVKISGEMETIKSVDLAYHHKSEYDGITKSETPKLHVKSHNDKKKNFFITYERLDEITITSFPDNNFGKKETETKIINYETYTDEEYIENYPIIGGGDIYITGVVFVLDADGNTLKQYFIEHPITLTKTEVYFKEDHDTEPEKYYFKPLKRITLDEKKKQSIYDFDSYRKGHDRLYLAREEVHGFCTNEELQVKELVNEEEFLGDVLSKEYYYKKNSGLSLMPFSKSLMVTEYNEYGFDSISDSIIDARSFELGEGMTETKYKFAENTVGLRMGVIERKEGIINGTLPEKLSNKNEEGTYFYDTNLEQLDESIKSKLYYHTKVLNMGSNYKVNGVYTGIYDNITDTLIPQSKSMNTYYNDINENLDEEIYYVDSKNVKSTKYTYDNYNEISSEDVTADYLLNPLVLTVESDIDVRLDNDTLGHKKSIQTNTYIDGNINGTKVISSVINEITGENGDSTKTYTYLAGTNLVETESGKNGLVTTYEYDDMNKVNKVITTGSSLKNKTETEQKTIINCKYYDNRTGLVLGEDTFDSTDTAKNGSVALNYYDYEGMLIKQVNLLYKDGAVTGKAQVKVMYNEEINIPIGTDNHIYTVIGSYSYVDDPTKYAVYYARIKAYETSDEYIESLTAYETDYDGIINTLKDNDFDFELPALTGLGYLSAGQTFSHMGLVLLKESYSRDPDPTDGNVTKIYETYKLDLDGKVLAKKLDEDRHSLEYRYEYDHFGNLTKEIFPGGIQPDVTYSTIYKPFETVKTTKIKYDNDEKSITTQTYDARGKITYKNVNVTNSVKYDEGYVFDYAGRLLEKTDNSGIVQQNTYNFYGMKSSELTGSDGKNIRTNYVIYDEAGNSTRTYGAVALNTGFDPDIPNTQNNWSTEKEYDDFGRVNKERIKYDTEVLKEGETIPAAGYFTKYYIYNNLGQLVKETSDRFEGQSAAIQLLDDAEYEYDEAGNVIKKTTYGLDNTGKTVTYIEDYDYDDYYRLKWKKTTRDSLAMPNELMSKTFVGDYDENGNLVEQYEWSKGTNWSYVQNIYEKGLLIRVESKVLDDNDGSKTAVSELNPDLFILRNYKYIKYDEYNRVTSEVDFDGNGSTYKYDPRFPDKKIEVYSGVNYGHNIVDGKIDPASEYKGTPIEFIYDNAGLLVKEEMAGAYLKEYDYDTFGRKTTESISRYKDNFQKKILYTYDSLGRTVKTDSDNVSVEVTEWETDGNKRSATLTTISNSNIPAFEEYQELSIFGNTVKSKDRDGYIFEDKIDKYGNTVTSTKTVLAANYEIYNTTYTYDEESLLLEKEETTSPLGADKQIEYTYDIYSRTDTITNLEYQETDYVVVTVKTFTYTEDNQISTQALKIDGTTYVTGYEYNETGALEAIVYPDGKRAEYSYTAESGKLSGASFETTNIITNVNYYKGIDGSFEETGTVESITNGAGITTAYEFDKYNRIKSKIYTDQTAVKILQQDYAFDKAGNITSIIESGTGLAGYFARRYEYDEYNQLIKAEYDGKVIEKIQPKITYKEYDYKPYEYTYLNVGDMNDDTHEIKSIESKAASIILTDPLHPGQEFQPSLVRILKQENTELTQNKIIPYYLSGSQFIKAELNNDYKLTEDDDYFTFSEWTRETKALKINIVVDNSDKYDTPDEKNAEELNKLVEFYGKVDNIDFEFNYDSMGNRLYKSQRMYREDRSILIKEDENNYTYSDDKRFIDTDDTYKYYFDDDGFLWKKEELANPLNYWKMDWDALGDLIKVTKYENDIEAYYEEYIYDEGGQRVKTKTVDKTTINIYDGLQKLFERITTSEETKDTHYVYALGELQAVIEDGIENFYFADILGSTRFITDNAGNVIQESIFEPFGSTELLNAYNNGGKYTFFYSSHAYEKNESNLVYMQSRWCDPDLGRFASSDPAQQGINHYIYAGNNPVSNVDLDGLLFEGLFNFFGPKTGNINNSIPVPQSFYSYGQTSTNFGVQNYSSVNNTIKQNFNSKVNVYQATSTGENEINAIQTKDYNTILNNSFDRSPKFTSSFGDLYNNYVSKIDKNININTHTFFWGNEKKEYTKKLVDEKFGKYIDGPLTSITNRNKEATLQSSDEIKDYKNKLIKQEYDIFDNYVNNTLFFMYCNATVEDPTMLTTSNNNKYSYTNDGEIQENTIYNTNPENFNKIVNPTIYEMHRGKSGRIYNDRVVAQKRNIKLYNNLVNDYNVTNTSADLAGLYSQALDAVSKSLESSTIYVEYLKFNNIKYFNVRGPKMSFTPDGEVIKTDYIGSKTLYNDPSYTRLLKRMLNDKRMMLW